MVATLLECVPFHVDVQQLYRRLRIVEGTDDAKDVESLVQQAEALAKPKAYYRPAYVEERDDESVVIDGVRFTSRVLRVNLEAAHRVFPYVATCGVELEKWSLQLDDLLHRYWASIINEMAMRAAFQALETHIVEVYQLGKAARMNPGSLADWPISQQKPLFDLLGDVTQMTGVSLTESYLMLPIKSVSGLWFPTETSFESCQLCPREGCPGRRAAFDAALLANRYSPAAGERP